MRNVFRKKKNCSIVVVFVIVVGLANNRRPQSPRHKTASEFWIDTLRKTGTGKK